MFICKLPKWKYWTAYLSSLARDKRSQRFGVETRESETQTAVHAVCCQLERFLPNVILKQWHTVHHINPQAGVRKSLEKCAASHILPTILSPSPYDPLLIWKILTQGCFKKTTNFYFLITWKIILIFLMQIGPSLLSWYFHPHYFRWTRTSMISILSNSRWNSSAAKFVATLNENTVHKPA